MRRRGLDGLIGLLLPLALAGCVSGNGSGTPVPSQTPGSSQDTKLSVGNWTTIPVTLVVNGVAIETIPAGGYEDPIKASLPALPWNVESRSPSGRVLSTLVVHSGDFVTWTSSGGGGGARGDSVRVDLSCGRLDVWYGTPMLGPAPDPNASYPPGDCA
jgi:hypothetical protein